MTSPVSERGPLASASAWHARAVAARRKGARSAGDRADLDQFLRAFDDLAQRRLFQDASGLSTSWTVSWSQGQPLSIATTMPNPDLFLALLASARPLLTLQGPPSLGHTLGILWRRLDSDALRERMAEVSTTFTTSKRLGTVGLIVNDEQVSPILLLDLYINGQGLHADTDKRARLDTYRAAIPGLTETAMVELVDVGIRCLIETRAVILEARDRGLLD